MVLLRQRHGLVATLALLPSLSSAHLVSTGLGPIYDGIGHFFLSLEDLVPLLALMALGGLHSLAGARRIALLVPAFWLCGGVLGVVFMPATSPPAATSAVMALATGILLMTDVWMSLPVLTGLGFSLAVLSGLTTASALAGQTGSALMLLGSAAALVVVSSLIPAAVIAMCASAPWMRVAIRVLGSWIAAVGLLMLGWQFRT